MSRIKDLKKTYLQKKQFLMEENTKEKLGQKKIVRKVLSFLSNKKMETLNGDAYRKKLKRNHRFER